MASILEASPDNNYLGFCRGAWNLQNGDRRASMQKTGEGRAYSRNGAASRTATIYFQKCRAPKCTYRSIYGSPDPGILWTKVFEFAERGIKLRWTFLAKSHVPQRTVTQNKYLYKCLFCVLQGLSDEAIYPGTAAYLDHICSEHRGQEMDPVLLYKTRCLNNRVADDKEDFDINIWPDIKSKEPERVSVWLSEGDITPAAKQRQENGLDHSNGHLTDKTRLPCTEEAGQERETETDAIARASLAARVDRLFAPPPIVSQDMDPVNGMALEQLASSAWADIINNPWLETTAPGAIVKQQTVSDDSGNANIHGQTSIERTTPVPQIPPRSRLRPSHSFNRLSHTCHDSAWTTSATLGLQETITACLRDIGQVYDDSLILLADISQQAAQTKRTPPDLLLQHVLSDNASEIEKLRQRGIALFGPPFNSIDDITINALQNISRQLQTGLFRPLVHAARNADFSNYAPLLDVVENVHQATVAILKQRLTTLQAASGRHHDLNQSSQSAAPYTGGPRASHDDLQMPSHFSEASDSAIASAQQLSMVSGSSGPALGTVPPEPRRRNSILKFLRLAMRSNQY